MTPLSEVPRPRALWLRSGAALLALVVLIVAAPTVPPLSVAETWLADLRQALLAPEAPPHPRILVVDIDEDAIAAHPPRSPIDRAYLARIVEAAAAGHPAAIGIDILVDRPSVPEKDDALRATLHGVQAPVILGWAEVQTAVGIDEHQERFLREFLRQIDNPEVSPGLVVLLEDRDGVIRRLSLRTRSGTVRESFALALSRLAGGSAPEGSDLPLAYYGHPSRADEPFSTVPADSFLNSAPEAQRRMVEGRVVLIGASLVNADTHRTPFASDVLAGPRTIHGVFVQAQAVAQLLDGRQLAAAPLWLTVLIAVAVVAAGFHAGVRDRSNLLRAGEIAGALALLVAAVCVAYRFGGSSVPVPAPGPLLPLATPALGLLAAVTVGIAHGRQRYAAEKRFVRSVLTRYVPPPVVDRLLRHPEELKLGGERREMSFVFTDIQGFTTLCESTEPEILVPALNDYLGDMTEIVLRHGGTVGGFIGDAVVGFWGAPLDDPEQAKHALEAAIEMNRYTRAFPWTPKSRGLPFGHTRIGVHKGLATVGNFGGARRLEYMAHGDVVNTASRLEGANKFLGTSIAVSNAIAAEANGIALRPAGDLVLKGKSTALPVFEPAEQDGNVPISEYLAAFELMRRGAPEARAAFERLHERCPTDPLVRLHAARLRAGATGVRIILEEK